MQKQLSSLLFVRQGVGGMLLPIPLRRDYLRDQKLAKMTV
jgi:hypothetical protein